MRASSKVSVKVVIPTYTHSGQEILSALPLMPSASHISTLSSEAILFNLMTPEETIKPPYAAISALGCMLQPTSSSWLRIDPIELCVDAGNIYLVGRDHLLLEQNETIALIASLNELLKEDGLVIQAGSAREWFLHLPQLPALKTIPLYEAIAKDIKAFLPSGLDQKWWNKLITELQMLLFQHTVNQLRHSCGKPSVHSVWIWGEGELPSSYPLNCYQKIWSDNSLIKGMVALSKQQSLLNEVPFDINAINAPGQYLITINHFDASIEKISAILLTLLQSLKDNDIQELSLQLGGGHHFRWQKPKRRFFSRFK